MGQEDSCTLCFHFIPTPLQKALGGKLKAGTLAHSLDFLSFLSFFSRMKKGSFKPLRIVLEPLVQKGTATLGHCMLFQMVVVRVCLYMTLCIQIDDRGVNPSCSRLSCDSFRSHFSLASLSPGALQLCSF